MNEEACKLFQKLRQNIRIGTQDLRISCVALTHDLILVTNNLKDFKKVPGLQYESWAIVPQP